MPAEMGEFVVGAYLKEEIGCDFVDYGVRPPVGGRRGQFEFDVLGLRFRDSTAFLCEVATHLDGLKYGSNEETLERIQTKHQRQLDYAAEHLGRFATHRFMLWSPRVPVGVLTKALAKLPRLELVINADYAQAVAALRQRARVSTRDLGNPFFRAIQILEHLRE